MFDAEPKICAFDLRNVRGVPRLKSWKDVTSTWKLAKNLDARKCQHKKGFKHAPLEGRATSKSAFYIEETAKCNSFSLYEIMCVLWFRKVKGSIAQSFEEISVGVLLLLNTEVWHENEGWKEAIQKETDGHGI